LAVAAQVVGVLLVRPSPFGFLHQYVAGLDHGLNLLRQCIPVRFCTFQCDRLNFSISIRLVVRSLWLNDDGRRTEWPHSASSVVDGF
jgi:hypothetical protein